MTNDKAVPATNAPLAMTVDIVAAYLGKNPVPTDQVGALIGAVHRALAALGPGSPVAPLAAEVRPAISIKRSVAADYIVCLEDGKKLKMLKRHLRTAYKLTPEQYRAKWGLPPDYPMVAPNYAAQRSAFAKRIGLGRLTAGRKGKRR